MAMAQFDNNQLIARFQNFRQKLYDYFESCSDACMDLLDTLAGNTGARSIAELSLSPLFPRSYNSIYKAIKASFNTNIQEMNKEEGEEEKPNNLIRVVSELIDEPQQRPFYLFGTDTTPHPRPYARTLPEREYIYQPNTIKGNKPINVGHCYSVLSILSEKEQKMYRHPFTLIRVHVTDDTGNSVWKPMWLIVIGEQCGEISPTVFVEKPGFPIVMDARMGRINAHRTGCASGQQQFNVAKIQIACARASTTDLSACTVSGSVRVGRTDAKAARND